VSGRSGSLSFGGQRSTSGGATPAGGHPSRPFAHRPRARYRRRTARRLAWR